MGCGASKGKSEAQATVEDIEFKVVGISSLDDVFNKAKQTLDSVKEITGPLGD